MPPCTSRTRRCILFALGILGASGVRAQSPRDSVLPTASILAGRVLDDRGRPRSGATVMLLETLVSVRTDSLGRFTLRTDWKGPATLVARAVGGTPATRDLTLPTVTDSALVLTIVRADALSIVQVIVAASDFMVSDNPAAALTPLEVARTPGTTASVARAIQTLPGVQNVDEGTGVFVRGGDLLETRVLVDDAWLPAPYRADNPTGSAGATVDPFLLRAVNFIAGTPSARHGNALSGIVALDLQERPASREGAVSASLIGGGARIGLPVTKTVGVRAAASVSNLAPLFALFGEAQPFNPAPQGGDLSGSMDWTYRDGGRVRTFALAQRNTFGVGAPSGLDAAGFRARTDTRLALVSWRDSARRLQPAATAAYAAYRRDEAAGDFGLVSHYDIPQLLARINWQHSPTLRLTAGGELERIAATFRGQVRTAGAPATTVIDAATTTTRLAQFAELAWLAPAAVSVIAGVRSDDVDGGIARTWDPRLSLAWQHGRATFTAATAQVHQLPDAALRRGPDAPVPMRVRQATMGARWDGAAAHARLELYTKSYDHLVLVSRNRAVFAGGRGAVQGGDLIVRWRPSERYTVRSTWSVLDAERTDPDSRTSAPSPTDVTHSLLLVVERRFGRVQLSAAWRSATGRPFTDVLGVRDSLGMAQPIWGAPFGARLPAQQRVDASIDWFRPLGAHRALVCYASLSNLTNRVNVNDVVWRSDWSARIERRAPFARAVFVGATLTTY
jgi:vitamin B12 transporter